MGKIVDHKAKEREAAECGASVHNPETASVEIRTLATKRQNSQK